MSASPTEQKLVNELYDAIDRSATAGLSLQSALGHINALRLHLEYKIVQGVSKTEERERRDAAPHAEGEKQ